MALNRFFMGDARISVPRGTPTSGATKLAGATLRSLGLDTVTFVGCPAPCEMFITLSHKLACVGETISGTIEITSKVAEEIAGTWSVLASIKAKVESSESKDGPFVEGNSGKTRVKGSKTIYLRLSSSEPIRDSVRGKFSADGFEQPCETGFLRVIFVRAEFEPTSRRLRRPQKDDDLAVFDLKVEPRLFLSELDTAMIRSSLPDFSTLELLDTIPLRSKEAVERFIVSMKVKAGAGSRTATVTFVPKDSVCATAELTAVDLTRPLTEAEIEKVIPPEHCKIFVDRYKPSLFTHSSENVGPYDYQFFLDNAQVVEDGRVVLGPGLDLVGATRLRDQTTSQELELDSQKHQLELIDGKTPGIAYADLFFGIKGRKGAPTPTVYYRCAIGFGHPGFDQGSQPLAKEPLLFLQFWFFFAGSTAPGDDALRTNIRVHQGDWEFMQVVLRIDEASLRVFHPPIGVTFSQHFYGMGLDWNDTRLGKIEQENKDVFFAAGSHAPYPQTNRKYGTESKPKNWPGDRPTLLKDDVATGKAWTYSLVPLPRDVALFRLPWGKVEPLIEKIPLDIAHAVPSPSLRQDWRNTNFYTRPEEFHFTWRRDTPKK